MRNIKYGHTRMVLLFPTFVIKVPLSWHVRYPVLYFLRKEFRTKNNLKFQNIRDALTRCLDGWYSNRIEYLYSKKNPKSKGLMHTKSLFFSLITRQHKGEVLHENDIRWKQLKECFVKHEMKEMDLFKPCNFCIYENQVKLLDYGKKETLEALENGALKIIEACR